MWEPQKVWGKMRFFALAPFMKVPEGRFEPYLGRFEPYQKFSKILKNSQKFSKIFKNSQKFSKILKNFQKFSKFDGEAYIARGDGNWYIYVRSVGCCPTN